MGPATRGSRVDQPHQLRVGGIGDVPARGLSGAAIRDVEPVVRLVHDRMVCVLPLETVRAISLGRQGGPADEFGILRILEIPDVQHDLAEARLAGAGIVEARLLGPVAFVRPHDELAAASGAARVRRRSRDFRDERNLRRIGIPGRDVENLEPEVLAGVVAADQIVPARGIRVEPVVIHDRHRARVHASYLVGDVPDEFRVGRIGDLDDRRAVPFHLAGDRIQDRLVLHLPIVGGLRVAPVVGRMAHVRPVAIGRVRSGVHFQRLTALQILESHQPHVFSTI